MRAFASAGLLALVIAPTAAFAATDCSGPLVQQPLALPATAVAPVASELGSRTSRLGMPSGVLAQAPDVFTIGDESHLLIEGVSELAPAARGFESNRLVAADATPAVIAELRDSFFAALRDRAGRRPDAGARVRMLEKTPKNALRVPFLARVFPEARFIYLHRDPRLVLASMTRIA